MNIVLPTLHARRSAQAIPLAAGCLAAALPAELRETTTLLDLYPDQSDQEILTTILAASPALIAFPVYVWNRLRIEQLARQLHQLQPKIFLVAGGPEATGDPAGMASGGSWHALVHGEGEFVFRELITAITAGDLASVPAGVTLPQQEHSALQPSRPRTQDWSTLPSPWLAGLLAPTAEGGVLWEVARGCAFACDFCFDARGQQGVRSLDFERLAAELDLFCRSGVSQVWVLDATFNYPPERGVALLELLLEKAPHLHYHLEAKADFLDARTANLLSQLNCSVQLGLQSVNSEVLKLIHRPLDRERFTEQVHLLAAEGVTYGFDLIYGLPGDDYAGFRHSLDTAMELVPNHVHIFPLAVLPGTRLAQQRERHGLRAQEQPPYEILSTDSWSEADLASSRRLAAATDIFFNCGRAVAFFPALLHLLETSPGRFLEEFAEWCLAEEKIDHEQFFCSDTWTSREIYRLQQRFMAWQLCRSEQPHLLTAVLDLLCYHYYYAETLLGEELLPVPAGRHTSDPWETIWQLSPRVRLVPFAYEIYDLMEMEGIDLVEFSSLFRPVGSVALFLRRGGEVFCESLEEDFLRLLQSSRGEQSPREIFAGSLTRAAGEELLHFALSEGLLQPADTALAT